MWSSVLLYKAKGVVNLPIAECGVAKKNDRWHPRLLEPLVQPTDHRLVPENAVVRLEDPVIFIRKIKQFARNAEPLEGVKRAEALRLDHSKILAAMNDEHGSFPILHIVDGVVLLVALRIIPRRSNMVPLRKPKLFGVEIGKAFVQIAIVID